MKTQFVTVKTAELNNHCPECYSTEGLKLTFSQRFIENAFYRALTSKTSSQLHCDVCKTDIFPVNWTEDIERVVDYHNKAFVPKPTTFKLKNLAWALIIAIDAIILFALLVIFKVIKI